MEKILRGKKEKIIARSQLPEEFNELKTRLCIVSQHKVQMTCSPKGKGKDKYSFANEEELNAS